MNLKITGKKLGMKLQKHSNHLQGRIETSN